MGRYVSIRGWLELDDELTNEVKSAIEQSPTQSENFGVSPEDAEFYIKGWTIPSDYINWTRYIFYGADIRLQGLKFMKSLLEKIAQIQLADGGDIDFVTGVFFIDDEGEDRLSLLWEIKEGQLIEISRK